MVAQKRGRQSQPAGSSGYIAWCEMQRKINEVNSSSAVDLDLVLSDW